MSVETLYTDTDQKNATKRAVVAGIDLGEIYQISWEFAVGRVPTATIIVPNPAPVFAKYFADATIDAGFNGLTERVFTGKVMNVAANERQTEIACAGLSQFLDKPSEDVTLLIDNTDNITVLNAIFALAGISFFEIDLPTTPLGTNVVSTLQFQSFAEAVDKVAEIDGGRWIELPSGLIRVIVADPIPQASTNRTYFTMNLTALVESRPAGLLTGRPRIRTVRKSHDVAKVKNRIHVRGAAVTTGELTVDIESTITGPSDFVLNPDGSQAFNDLLFANDLIDNQALSDAVVTRLLAVNNRLVTVLNLQVDGDPLRRLGESIRVEDESYPIITGRFFLERYRSVMGQNDFLTLLTVLGEGTSTGEDPVSEVNFCQMMSIVIDDRKYTVVTLDGRGSFSPSGVAITTYAWSDNQTPQVATGSDPVITVRIDPAAVSPTPWTVTLTITDANGNQDSVDVEIDPIECGDDCVNIATLFSALDTDSSASSDGGETWNDDPQNSVSAAAHPSISGLAVYGTSGGIFYQTTDYALNVTLIQDTGSGSPVRDITWDPDNHDVVWAVLDNAEVWRSPDRGASWSQYAILRVVIPGISGACGHRIKIIGGTAFVFGGEGNGEPLIAVDVNKSNSWTKVVLGGDLTADLASIAHSNSLYVADGAIDELWRLAIILNDATFEPSVYYTVDLFGDGTQWQRATGLPAGKSRGRWLDADLEETRFAFQYDDEDIYLGDVTAGVLAASLAAAALDGGDGANHGFWVGEKIPGMGAVYIVDAGSSAGGADIATGTYVGSGVGQAIAVGFRPDCVIVFQDGRACMIKGVDSVWGTRSAEMDGSMNAANGITSLTATGFVVGNDFNVDQAGRTFHWMAIGGGTSFVKSGTYVGAGGGGASISGVGFPPVMVTVHMDGPWQGAVKTNTMGGLDSKEYGSLAFQTDEILSLDADGFTYGAGTSVNSIFSDDFLFIAFSAQAGLQLSNYIGDNIDGRQIDAGNWSFLMLMPDLTEAAHMKIDTMAADAAKEILNVGAIVTNVIQDDDPFEVGSADAANLFPENYHWIGFQPSVSGDGTIYISWTRFADIGKIRPATGFPPMPVGANARMTDLGAPALCPELYLQGERVGFFQETAQLNGTTWVVQSTDADLADWHLINLNGVLYRIANINAPSTQGGLGDLERSTDLGVTWTIVIGQNTVDEWGIASVTIGPDGVLWAGSRTIANASTPIRIYKSTDNGVTWVRVLTGFESGTQHRTIDMAVDPFNASNIAISCERFNNIEVVLVSTDGGSSWVSRAGPPGFNADFGFWIAFGDDGRLLAATNIGIFTSDDLGVTWVQRDTLAAFATAFLIRGPGVDEFLYPNENGIPQWRLRRSRNNGQTWEELVNETDLYAASGDPLWSGTFLQDGSLVIATRPNATDAGTPVTIWRQANPFATVVPAFSTWENWTYNWSVTIGGGDIGLQGLASILREGH